MKSNNVIVQGNGHVVFEDGFKCAAYIDYLGNIYCTSECYSLEDMITEHGACKDN